MVPLQRYVAPTNVNAAKLQIRSQITDGSVHVVTFDDGMVCTGKKLIATNGKQPTTELQADTRLAADTVATLGVLYIKDSVGCEMVFSFVPKANHTYQIRPQVSGNQLCYAPLYDVTNPIAPLMIAPIKRTSRKSTGTSDPNCTPLEIPKTDASSGSARRPGRLTLDDLKDLLPTAR